MGSRGWRVDLSGFCGQRGARRLGSRSPPILWRPRSISADPARGPSSRRFTSTQRRARRQHRAPGADGSPSGLWAEPRSLGLWKLAPKSRGPLRDAGREAGSARRAPCSGPREGRPSGLRASGLRASLGDTGTELWVAPSAQPATHSPPDLQACDLLGPPSGLAESAAPAKLAPRALSALNRSGVSSDFCRAAGPTPRATAGSARGGPCPGRAAEMHRAPTCLRTSLAASPSGQCKERASRDGAGSPHSGLRPRRLAGRASPSRPARPFVSKRSVCL